MFKFLYMTKPHITGTRNTTVDNTAVLYLSWSVILISLPEEYCIFQKQSFFWCIIRIDKNIFSRSHLRQSKLFWFYHFFYLRHSRKNNERLRIRAVKLTVQFQLPEKTRQSTFVGEPPIWKWSLNFEQELLSCPPLMYEFIGSWGFIICERKPDTPSVLMAESGIPPDLKNGSNMRLLKWCRKCCPLMKRNHK